MKVSATEKFIAYAVLIIGSIIALYPFLSIVLLSLTPREEYSGAQLIPTSFTLENYATAWERGGFGSALWSSLIVALFVIIGAVLCAILGGYAFATMSFPLQNVIIGVFLLGLIVPYEGIIIPLYHLLDSMNLLNTYWALILPQIATSIPLGMLWMRTTFKNVPPVLQESASLDGSSRWKTLWRIYFPISLPGIATLSTLLFLYTWNEFLMALVLVPQNKMVQTAPLALSFFAGSSRNFDATVTAAAAVLVALPIIVMYVIFQRKFISGIASGAVKE